MRGIMLGKARLAFLSAICCVAIIVCLVVTRKMGGAVHIKERFVPSRGSTARHSHSFDETVGRTRILGGSRTASESSDDHSGRRAAESHDESDTLDERDEARTVHTFFSTMPKTFHDIRLHSDDSIPVSTFLDACRAILPIFDKLNPTAFAPVKMDVAGNIRKIQQKYSSNPKQFRTLQSMVLHEVQANQHRDSNSATESLLWLKRALEFILQFLLECLSGEQDMGVAASNAYSKTLQPFHSWVVRGVFALAAKALPYRTEFMNAMGATENDKDDPHFEQILEADLRHYTKHLTATLKIINAFYEEHQLNNEEQI